MPATFYSRANSYSRSYNAEEAESEGRLPLTRAITAVRGAFSATVKQARAALLATWDGEWHHVGKYAARVRYFCPEAAVAFLAGNAAGDLTPRQIEAARQWQWQQVAARAQERQLDACEVDVDRQAAAAAERAIIEQAESEARQERLLSATADRRAVAERVASVTGGQVLVLDEAIVHVRTDHVIYSIGKNRITAIRDGWRRDDAESSRVTALIGR